MDKEAEFLKACEDAKKRQAAYKVSQDKSASKIGATLNSSTLPSPKKSNALCLRCQKQIDFITTSSGLIQPRYCNDCVVDMEQESKARERRAWREAKVRRFHCRLGAIPERYQQARLHHLNPSFKEALITFERTTGVVVTGPVGTGKTYALAALMRYLLCTGGSDKHCERTSWEKLCIEIRATFNNESPLTENAILDRMLGADYLIIEDIGAGKIIDAAESDFSRRILYVVLDGRLEKCRPTFVSTNKSRETLSTTFDERIASRLSLFKWVGVGGQDKRKSL